MASAALKTTPDQRAGTWVFGSLLILFYLAVFLFGPSVLPDYKYQMLGIISALLGGLFGFFLTGQFVGSTKRPTAIRATGGVGIAVALLVWWGHGAAGIQTSTQAATQLQQQIQQAVVTAQSSSPPPASSPAQPAPNVPPRSVTLSPDVQKLAGALAAADPKYKNVAILRSQRPIPVETLSKLNASLATKK
jgi:hypothetical protein